MAHAIENVEIEPKPEVLEHLKLSTEDFYRALEKALDDLKGCQIQELPTPSQIPIFVRGRERLLGDLAQIAVSLNE